MDGLPVVRHVTLYQVAGGQGGHERQFAGQDGGAQDAGQPLGVVAGAQRVGAPHAEYLQAGRLAGQRRAAAHGADFHGRHGARDVKVAVERFHQRHAVAARHVLRRILRTDRSIWTIIQYYIMYFGFVTRFLGEGKITIISKGFL